MANSDAFTKMLINVLYPNMLNLIELVMQAQHKVGFRAACRQRMFNFSFSWPKFESKLTRPYLEINFVPTCQGEAELH